RLNHAVEAEHGGVVPRGDVQAVHAPPLAAAGVPPGRHGRGVPPVRGYAGGRPPGRHGRGGPGPELPGAAARPGSLHHGAGPREAAGSRRGGVPGGRAGAGPRQGWRQCPGPTPRLASKDRADVGERAAEQLGNESLTRNRGGRPCGGVHRPPRAAGEHRRGAPASRG
ncbi:unnamed protein product, partial [Prorocentrum cordatum]